MIWVYGQNNSRFKPWRGLTVVRNEHNQIIWWGMSQVPDSYNEIREPLVALKERLDRLNCTIKVVYVDDCCYVATTLRDIFGDLVQIKPDAFHWIMCWDDILVDPKSEESRRFKCLMSHAVLMVPQDEYKSTENELREKLGRKPSVKEVPKDAKTVVPPKAELETRIVALIDLKIEEEMAKLISPRAERTTNENTVHTTGDDKGKESESGDDTEMQAPKFMFKGNFENVWRFVNQQLEHVRNDCLSDPVDVTLHFEGGFTARGSSKNELAFSLLKEGFSKFKALGATKAERLLWTSFTEFNRLSHIKRRGAEDTKTDQIEMLLCINSLCEDCGIAPVYPDTSVPTQANL